MDVKSPFCMKDQGTIKVILVKKRQPFSFQDLTSDQKDTILNQVKFAQKDLCSTITKTDDNVVVQSEEDIAALCKDCNGTHQCQTAVQTQLKDIKSFQKALEMKVDSILEILTSFVKKQETCVTMDLNIYQALLLNLNLHHSSSKVTNALNNILTTNVVSTTAQDTSNAKISFNTSILEDTCDTSTTSTNLTTDRTSSTGNILTTLRASATSKNSTDSTTGDNSTSKTQTTSMTPTGSTPFTGNLTGSTSLTGNNSTGSTSSINNNLTGSTSSTCNLTGSTCLTSNNSTGSTSSISNNSTGSISSSDNNSIGSTQSSCIWI